jgi:hypothetical protein
MADAQSKTRITQVMKEFPFHLGHLIAGGAGWQDDTRIPSPPPAPAWADETTTQRCSRCFPFWGGRRKRWRAWPWRDGMCNRLLTPVWPLRRAAGPGRKSIRQAQPLRQHPDGA